MEGGRGGRGGGGGGEGGRKEGGKAGENDCQAACMLLVQATLGCDSQWELPRCYPHWSRQNWEYRLQKANINEPHPQSSTCQHNILRMSTCPQIWLKKLRVQKQQVPRPPKCVSSFRFT